MHVFCQVVLVSIFRCKSRPVHAGRQRTGENNPEEEADHESMNAVFSDDRKNESCSTSLTAPTGSKIVCPILTVILSDHGLLFYKRSTDGSWGVLKIDGADRGKLDKAETGQT